MKRVAFAVPGDLATPTGGYAYDRRIIEQLRALGWQVDVIGLGEGFPHPTSATKATARQSLLAVPRGVPIVVDGLGLGVLPEAASDLRGRNPLLGLVHHPLALETGLSAERAAALQKSETEALAAARGIVAVSPATAQVLFDGFDVPAELVTVVIPGTDRGEPAPGSSDGIVRLLSVGAVTPRKGFDLLIEALADLAGLPWRLTIAGDRSRDERTAAQLDDLILHHRLADRIDLRGALPPERMSALYAAADVFVLASRYEGYGMAYAEALAHGLPVIGTTAGAIPDTVPPSAGVLVEPDDVKALTRALRLLIENPKERKWLAEGAKAAGEALPSWPAQGRLFAAAIEAMA